MIKLKDLLEDTQKNIDGSYLRHISRPLGEPYCDRCNNWKSDKQYFIKYDKYGELHSVSCEKCLTPAEKKTIKESLIEPRAHSELAPKNSSDFKNSVERIFLRANPGAKIGKWTMQPKKVKYPTGLKGIMGKFSVSATGFQTKEMIAEWDAITGWGIR